MRCTICGQPVVLSPSAEERSRRFGETADFYRRLFPEHAECVIAKRSGESILLMRQLNNPKELA